MRLLEREKPILHFPLWLVRPAAKVIGCLPGQLFSADALDFLTQDGVADLAETSRRFPNFRPQKFETALKSYLEVIS